MKGELHPDVPLDSVEGDSDEVEPPKPEERVDSEPIALIFQPQMDFFARTQLVSYPRWWSSYAPLAVLTPRHKTVSLLSSHCGSFLNAFQVLQHMRISSVEGAAAGRYARWELISGDFWKAVKLPKKYASFVDEHAKLPPLPVFVDLPNAGPTGHLLTKMTSRPKCARGLLVQLYGRPNEVACNRCEESFSQSDSTEQAGMSPFFSCRSVPGRFSGACGNCVFTVAENACCLREDELAFLRARNEREEALIEDLTAENSPDETSKEGRDLVVLAERNEQRWRSKGE